MSRSRLVTFVSMAVVAVGVLVALGALCWSRPGRPWGRFPARAWPFPADARFLVGFDVKRLTESPFYKKYAAQGARPDAFADLEARTGHPAGARSRSGAAGGPPGAIPGPEWRWCWGASTARS